MRKSPSNFVDITGQTFNNWHVLERAPSRRRRVFYKCQCKCGFVSEVSKTALEHRHSKSCGCLKNFRHWDRTGENHLKPYSEEELDLIRQWYPVNGTRYLAKHLKRTPLAIRYQACRLRLKVDSSRKNVICRRRDEWREEELRVLYEVYPTEGVWGCLPLLPKRSKDAIWCKVIKLGIKLDRNKRIAA